ncbi:MAG: heavy metal translocating P-type ATPase [Deltaproteobacteria bacterium]|nr:heavy metal translocating P-type ATPase [Deltaproteobacteria bacterium]
MTGCADACSDELPAERPTLWGSKNVRASILAWLFAGLAFVAGWSTVPALQVGLFAAAILSGAFYFAREAIEELWKERKIGIELLMTAAIAGAAALGQWREAALVAALYSISEALEGFTIQRTRYAIRGLMDLVPPKARALRDGREVEIDVKDVQVGERIQIRPGESIPVDGVIREGASAINESAVTGESMPVERGVSQPVFAGTLNGNGALVVEATKTFKDNTVNQIIYLVERAQAQKGHSQMWVERFGRVYSPAVLGVSVLLGVVPLVIGLDAGSWLQRAVSFLVAASPCALAVATPVTLVAGIGSAAKRGVLIKGGNVLEVLGRVKAVALDKTGTVTQGKPEVTAIRPIGIEEVELLRLAAAAERLSEHPLAQAIVRAAAAREIELPAATDFRAITAAGVTATVERYTVAVLKPAAATERGVELDADADEWRKAAEARGQSAVIVVVNSKAAGVVALGDTIRPQASALVASLKRAGVEHIVMLTGDNAATAKSIAEQVGIEEFYGGLLPEDKVIKVKDLLAKYGSVAMVGDGINDAPALATASVGIAMGVAGSDAALAAADVALMADDLSKLEYAVKLGRRSTRIIAQNIGISLVIVAGLVTGVFAAGLSMFAAVVGHEGSEVLIILNGLRAAL